MLDQVFKSRLSKLSSKKKDDSVVQEFVLTHVSEEPVQNFLASWDEEHNLNLRHPFTSDRIEWKRISLDVQIPLLVVKFDTLSMDAMLFGINVSRKVTNEGETFRYDMIFHKGHVPEIDSVFAITFLNRQEENDNGKKVFLEYDTEIKKRSDC